MEKCDHKVYIIGGNFSIEKMFEFKGATIVDNLNEADIAVWTGGSDINPSLYGEKKHPKTHINPLRDKYEAACYKHCLPTKIKVGICRGAQFLNVMNGGSLWQDIDGHALAGTHEMLYKRSNGLVRAYNVTSTHHQQMIPAITKSQAQVWGFCGIATHKECGIQRSDKSWASFECRPGHSQDAEIVYYPGTRSLCFQPHPEYAHQGTRDLFFTCLERVFESIAA